MPRHVPAGRGYEHPEGAQIHASLRTPKDVGLRRRILYRLGIDKTVRLWGSDFEVPHHRMSKKWFWKTRNQSYERMEASAALACLNPALPVLEIGGGFGAVAITANKHIQPPAHVVIEMDEEMVGYIRRNVERNGCSIEVLHGVASLEPAHLVARPGFIGQQSQEGEGDTPWIDPRTVAAERNWDRINLFMDVEGAEVALLHGMGEWLKSHVDTLIMEVHGHKTHSGTVGKLPIFLATLGFEPVWLRDTVWAYKQVQA